MAVADQGYCWHRSSVWIGLDCSVLNYRNDEHHCYFVILSVKRRYCSRSHFVWLISYEPTVGTYFVHQGAASERLHSCSASFSSCRYKGFFWGGGMVLRWRDLRCSTYTPGHEVGEAPVVLLVEEEVANAATEGLLVIFVVDDLQHRLGMTRPRPSNSEQSQLVNQPSTFTQSDLQFWKCHLGELPYWHQWLHKDSSLNLLFKSLGSLRVFTESIHEMSLSRKYS